MDPIYELHADLCKIFSNAKRLEIIDSLKDKEMSASELIARIRLSKANLSQHMSVLKLKGVILTRREGVNIYYRIANPKILQACHLIREALFEQVQRKREDGLRFQTHETRLSSDLSPKADQIWQ